MTDRDVAKVRSGIEVALELDGESDEGKLSQLVATYLGLEGHGPGFAGRHFTSLGDNPPDAWTSGDLLSLALLDVPVGHLAVTEVLIDAADQFTELLNPEKLPTERDLWEATDAEMDAATQLWERLQKIPEVGWVRAHKLVARKRPRLHPVYDNVVHAWFGTDGIRYPLREVLADREYRDTLDKKLEVAGDKTPLIRRLDIAIWMLGSRQRPAVDARNALGIESPKDRVLA